jgi:hypothetical protein
MRKTVAPPSAVPLRVSKSRSSLNLLVDNHAATA